MVMLEMVIWVDTNVTGNGDAPQTGKFNKPVGLIGRLNVLGAVSSLLVLDRRRLRSGADVCGGLLLN